ncbi:MAG: tRNA (N(6)-L-threonylcarbamoyladenosine(37)-C(2))-methylthiotransferase MtaB [Paludibacteraceae bacterium]|nr:tRNA (N(6)-L-threonylcarbamoyladenosine(37)-C(2))-methylthiotransferase MtaB [Paludibacteraceae bacterium]
MFEDKKVAFYTLGCKLNFTETSSIVAELLQLGFRKAMKDEVADVCIINTCTVTDSADKKCRQAIHKIVRRNPDAYIIVVGCYAQLKSKEIKAIAGVDLVLGANDKFKIPFILQTEDLVSDAVICSDTKCLTPFYSSSSADDRTRHFLKVQDGCDYFCSYCTIPFARGRSRNGKISDLVESANKIAQAGGKEIVLTGVNIGDFGKSTGETFFDLIKALDEVEGIERFRISSIEPNLLTDEIIDFVAESKRFAPHFHIPLQSGSDAVLKLMRRRYDTALFAQKIDKIKSIMPNAFIGVDVIVGMRGETNEFFDETYNFIKGLNVSQLHVFSYSERAQTQALKIEPKVTMEEKKRRSKLLLELSNVKLRNFYNGQLNSSHLVIWESTKHAGNMCGFTENYVKVVAPYDAKKINSIQQVLLNSLDETDVKELKVK